jgi:hypothetical protein
MGEELFLDYNRFLYQGKCRQEEDFYFCKFKKQKKCMECHNLFFLVENTVVHVKDFIFVLISLINIRLSIKCFHVSIFP